MKKDEKNRSDRKVKNQLANEDRHQTNLLAIGVLGLQGEKTLKTITRTTKQGKKVHQSTIQVEKNKRPSKILRKARRQKARLELGNSIDTLNSKLTSNA